MLLTPPPAAPNSYAPPTTRQLACRPLLNRLSRRACRRPCPAYASAAPPAPLPRTYRELYAQAKAALLAARTDGVVLQELHFPPCGLQSVAGDVEGNVENDTNVKHARELVSFLRGEDLQRARVWLPDPTELEIAVKGTSEGVSGPFAGFPGRLSALFHPGVLAISGLSRLFGIHEGASSRAAADDSLHLAAYPSGNIDELLECCELHASSPATPLVVLNGELERIRSGFYPAFWARAETEPLRAFCPRFTQVYLLHNFKGAVPAVLHRCYPGPFRVLQQAGEGHVCVYESETYPGLREVAINILPRALRERRAAGNA
jgi:hypothetical protein